MSFVLTVRSEMENCHSAADPCNTEVQHLAEHLFDRYKISRLESCSLFFQYKIIASIFMYRMSQVGKAECDVCNGEIRWKEENLAGKGAGRLLSESCRLCPLCCTLLLQAADLLQKMHVLILSHCHLQPQLPFLSRQLLQLQQNTTFSIVMG